MMKVMKRLIMHRPWAYAGSTFSWAVTELMPLLPGFLIKMILDTLSAERALAHSFWWLVAALAGAYLARIITTYAGVITYTLYSFPISSLMWRNLLQAVFRRPGAAALPVSPSEAANRFRDDVSAIEELVGWPQDVFGKLLCALVAVGVLLAVDARMTLLICIPLGAILALVQQLRKRVTHYREAGRKATGSAIAVMGEILGSVQAIQVAGAESPVMERFQAMSHVRRLAMVRDAVFVKVIDSILNNIVHFGTGLILLAAAAAMRAGRFSVGDFALFTAYWDHIADFAHNCGNMLAAYHQARVSLTRLDELTGGDPDALAGREEGRLAQVPAQGDMDAADPGAEVLVCLEVKGLSHRFSDSGNGIHDVHFTIRGGTLTVITGAVGSGKTTLLRTLLGLLPADGGTVFWNGRPVADPGRFFIPPRAAYTSQVPHLFSDTIRHNVLLGCPQTDPDIRSAVRAAVLEEDLSGFADGLDTVIGPRGVRLSGGQLQRVAAARMFASRARLYVFDDISSALDVETENILWKRLSENPDITCIAVSTRPAALQRADQIIVLQDGRVAGTGSLKELLAGCPPMRSIYSGQSMPA